MAFEARAEERERRAFTYQRLMRQYLYLCPSKASTFVLVQQVRAPPFNDIVGVRIGVTCYTSKASTFALVKPHFNDEVGVRKGVERVLDVALADDTEVPHYLDGCVAEHVVVAVVQRLRGVATS